MRKSLLFCPVALLLCCPLLAQAAALEDANVRVEIGAKGELVSLVCKATGHEWAGKGGLWRLYFDKRFTPPGTPVAQVREEREISVRTARYATSSTSPGASTTTCLSG